MPDSDYMRLVGQAIDAACYYRRVTTQQLAERVRVDPETVRRWKRGERVPSSSDASKITLALDAPGDLLMRPPATREAAPAMMGAWDELRAVDPRT